MFFSFAMSLSASWAWGEENRVSCRYAVDSTLSECKVQESQIGEATEFAHADYTVAYNFNCGTSYFDSLLEIGIETQESFTKLRVGHVGTARVTGSGAAKLVDRRKETTFNALLPQPCSLEITDVKIAPSSNTILLWISEATFQATLIEKSMEFYLLAKNVTDIHSWSKDKLKLMKEKLEVLVQNEQDNLHYRVMLTTVSKALEGLHSPYQPQQIQDASVSLADYTKSEMLKDRDEGMRMQDRFMRWGQAVRSDLEAAIQRIGAL